jgi:hypothetical protein
MSDHNRVTSIDRDIGVSSVEHHLKYLQMNPGASLIASRTTPALYMEMKDLNRYVLERPTSNDYESDDENVQTESDQHQMNISKDKNRIVNGIDRLLMDMENVAIESGYIQDLKQTTKEWKFRKVPQTSSKYTKMFLRPPKDDSERPCANVCSKTGSSNCVSSHWGGFALREFLLPDHLKKRPKKRRQCILCNRRNTGRLYNHFKTLELPATMILNDHQVMINEVGEYAPDSCLSSSDDTFYGISGPFPTHTRNRYTQSSVVVDEREFPCWDEKSEYFFCHVLGVQGAS